MQNKKMWVGVIIVIVLVVTIITALKINKKNVENVNDGKVVMTPTPTPVPAPTSIFNVKPLTVSEVKGIIPDALFADKEAKISYLNQVTPKTPDQKGAQYSLRYSTTETIKTVQKNLVAALTKEGYVVGKASESAELIVFGAKKTGAGDLTVTILPEQSGSRVEANVIIK
jgi:hypothetical protein